MSGQSANLSLKEARAMQQRVQHSGSHANTNVGSGKSKPHGQGKMKHESMKKSKNMEEC